MGKFVKQPLSASLDLAISRCRVCTRCLAGFCSYSCYATRSTCEALLQAYEPQQPANIQHRCASETCAKVELSNLQNLCRAVQCPKHLQSEIETACKDGVCRDITVLIPIKDISAWTATKQTLCSQSPDLPECRGVSTQESTDCAAVCRSPICRLCRTLGMYCAECQRTADCVNHPECRGVSQSAQRDEDCVALCRSLETCPSYCEKDVLVWCVKCEEAFHSSFFLYEKYCKHFDDRCGKKAGNKVRQLEMALPPVKRNKISSEDDRNKAPKAGYADIKLLGSLPPRAEEIQETDGSGLIELYRK